VWEEALRRPALLAGAFWLAIATVLAALWWFSDHNDRRLIRTAAFAHDGGGKSHGKRRWMVSLEERQAPADHRNLAEAVPACSGFGTLDGQAPSVLEALRISPQTRSEKLAALDQYPV